MKTAGVICEYNPFHAGHAYLLHQLRGAGTVCFVMLFICLILGYLTMGNAFLPISVICEPS